MPPDAQAPRSASENCSETSEPKHDSETPRPEDNSESSHSQQEEPDNEELWQISVSYQEHIDHTHDLLNETHQFNFEHRFYELYDWILNFFAAKHSSENFRLSVYPQAVLYWSGPFPTLDNTGSTTEASEYKPEDDLHNLNIQEPSEASGSGEKSRSMPRRSLRIKEASAAAAKTAAKMSTAKAMKPKKQVKQPGKKRVTKVLVPDDREEDEDNMNRYPDFLVSITCPSKPMGIHTLWEVKRLPKRSSDSSGQWARHIAGAFNDTHVQLLQAAACAFHQFRFHHKVTYVCAVGYYLRRVTFRRDCMPLPEFDWASGSKRECLRWFLKNDRGRVWSLLDPEHQERYSPDLQNVWKVALDSALHEVEAAVDVTLEKMPLENLSSLIQEHLDLHEKSG